MTVYLKIEIKLYKLSNRWHAPFLIVKSMSAPIIEWHLTQRRILKDKLVLILNASWHNCFITLQYNVLKHYKINDDKPRLEKRCHRECAKCAFRSYCACANYHSGLGSPFIHSIVSNNSVSRQWRSRSDYAAAQADLGLRGPHMPELTLSHGGPDYVYQKKVIVDSLQK